MKKVFFILAAVAICFASCKSKKATQSAFEPAVQKTVATTEPKVFQVPEQVEAPKQVEESIPIRKESFTFTESKDETLNSYFIILGSFRNMENARKFRQELMTQGFTPIIVESETGYFRVTVDSYTNESDARSRLLQIRQNYSKYNDAWLLIKN